MKKKLIFILLVAATAQGILWGLLSDRQKDKALLSLLQTIDERMQDDTKQTLKKWELVDELQVELQNADARIVSLQKRLSGFQGKVETFQELERVQWVEEITARERTADTDYLYRLVKEKRIEDGRLSVAQIEAMTLSAEAALEKRDYARAKTDSLAALRSEPNNLKAAAVWCCATVILAPEGVDNERMLLPVAEYIAGAQPDNYPALLAAGLIYRTKGDYTLADERFRKAIEARPDLAEAMPLRVSVLTAQRRENEALPDAMNMWNAGIKSDDAAITVWQCLAGETAEKKRSFLNDWRRSVADSALPYGYLGDLSRSEGDPAGAVQWYRQAEQKRPSKSVYKILSDVYAETGDNANSILYAHKYISQLSPAVENDRADYLSYSLAIIRDDSARHQYTDVLADADAYLQARGDVQSVAVPVLESLMALKKYDEVQRRIKEMEKSIADGDVAAKMQELKTAAIAEIKRGKK